MQMLHKDSLLGGFAVPKEHRLVVDTLAVVNGRVKPKSRNRFLS